MLGRHGIAAVVFVALASAPGLAKAQTASNSWPVGTSLGGVGLTAPEGSECLVLPAGSSALVTGANTFINLPSIYGAEGLTYIPTNQSEPTITFIGEAQLAFVTPTSGVVKFDYYDAQIPLGVPKPAAPRVTFSDFKTLVGSDPATLKLSVRFHVDGCSVALHAIYHQP